MIDSPTLVTSQGQVYLNEACVTFKGGLMMPNSSQNPITVPAAVVNQKGLTEQIALETESDSWGEILSLYQNATGAADALARLSVDIREYRYGDRELCNAPINVNHVFGTRLNPFYLTSDDPEDNGLGESILLPPQNFITFKYTNPSTAGAVTVTGPIAERTKIQNKARLSARVNRQIKETYARQRYITPYWFTMDNEIFNGTTNTQIRGVTIPASQKADVFFTNKQNSTLLLTSLMIKTVTLGVAGDTQEVVTVELYDTTTGAPLQSAPVSMNCAAGTAAFPYRLPMPIFIGYRQSVRIRLTNLITDASTDVFATFYGASIWNPPTEFKRFYASGEIDT